MRIEAARVGRKAIFCKEVSAFVCCIAVPFRSYDTTF